ncbi:MAG: bifunctional 3-(3-hydroxy-phenyl)propionate/3-hydroxycinnamic acid hydroxylase [Dermatophilus congolensis]|nr:bifunctional 3-(3-hydroxy-phenyl)propionate/3-hydroxycinnamic acid hydroxylase [Dermatophilus congolensis]
MNQPERARDVAVIGYGPTGVVAALTLASKGASVVALEREADIYSRARAVTVNDWTMRIFQDLGIGDRVDRVIEPQRALRWVTYDGNEIMRIEHPPSSLGPPDGNSRFYNIYQPSMEAELRRCAEELPALEVNYGQEVIGVEQDDSGVTITSKNRETGEVSTTRAKYAIAADGGSSATRKALGIPMDGDTVPTLWIVIDCRVKRWWPDRDFLTFWSDRERPVVDIALSAGNHRWEIPLKPGETEADFPTAAEVWPLLEAMGVSTDDVEIHQYAFYRHHVRTATAWRSGRVFLAGDAAHLMPPWAGAGMQSGMRDAYNLGWKMARVLRGEFDDSWLNTYEVERRPNVAFYTNLAVALGRVIKQEATPEEVKAMNQIPENTVTPFEPPLTAPPVLEDGWLRGTPGDASIVGRMLPQPIMGSALGHLDRLDAHLGDNFTLLGADVDPATVLTQEEKAQWDALGARYIAVRPSTSFTSDRSDLVDLRGVLIPFLERYGVEVVAVRPDKFVAAANTSGLAVPTISTGGNAA